MNVVITPPPDPQYGAARVHKADSRALPACGSGDRIPQGNSGYMQTDAPVTCKYCLTDNPRETREEARWSSSAASVRYPNGATSPEAAYVAEHRPY